MILNILLALIALILFSLMIFVHELGHFFFARLFGVKVNEFALGMGPKILKFKKNETLYSLRAFPIGGFCEMEGEDEESAEEGSFGEKKAWQKIIIVAAGAIMNIIVGFFMIICLIAGSSKFASTTIKAFPQDSISYASGLRENDKILSVDGFKTNTFKDLSFALMVDRKEEFKLEVKRNDEKIKIENFKIKTTVGEDGKKIPEIDFYVAPIENNFGNLIKESFAETVSTVKITWASLIGLLTGRFPFNAVSGPVGIAETIGKSASEGLKTGFGAALQNIVGIMVFLTINLGIMNLLPIPALDGGRILFLIFELITKKKINKKYEGWIHGIGFVLLIGVMVLVFFNDIVRLIWK